MKALLFFWMVPGRVFLSDCVLTRWNVCWKRKASKPLSAPRSCPPSSGHWWLSQTLRYKRVNVSCQIFYDLKNSSGTFWNGSFFWGGGVLKWFKPLKSESHLWFARWRFRNYSLLVHNHLFLHVLRSERTSGLHSYQLFLFHLLSWPKLKCTS